MPRLDYRCRYNRNQGNHRPPERRSRRRPDRSLARCLNQRPRWARQSLCRNNRLSRRRKLKRRHLLLPPRNKLPDSNQGSNNNSSNRRPPSNRSNNNPNNNSALRIRKFTEVLC
jgi:hypothetical protein